MQKITKLLVVSLIMLALPCVASWAAPPADKTAQTPFQLQVTLTSDSQGSMGQGSFFIPTGKRLVIEFFSASMAVSGVDVVDLTIEGGLNNQVTKHHIVVTRQGIYDIYNIVNASQVTKMYFDAGNTVTITYVTSAASPNAHNGVATVTGYLETIQ
jgi:hypothetical protein